MIGSTLVKCLLVLSLAHVAVAIDWSWWTCGFYGSKEPAVNPKIAQRKAILDKIADIGVINPATMIKSDVEAKHTEVTNLMKALYPELPWRGPKAGLVWPRGYLAFDESKHHADDKAVIENYVVMDNAFRSLPLTKDPSEDPIIVDPKKQKMLADQKVIMDKLILLNKEFKAKKFKAQEDVKDRHTEVLNLMKKFMKDHHNEKTLDNLKTKAPDMSKAYQSMEKSYKELSSGGMGWGWWVLIILVLVGTGAALYCFFAGDSDDEEEFDEL